MWTKIRPVVLSLSLALNIPFLVMWTIHGWPELAITPLTKRTAESSDPRMAPSAQSLAANPKSTTGSPRGWGPSYSGPPSNIYSKPTANDPRRKPSFGGGPSSGKPKTQLESSLNQFRRIGLSEEQMREIEPSLARFHESSSEIFRELHLRKQEMYALVAAPEIDRDAIRVKEDEIVDCYRRMQDLSVENMLAEKEILTPEQQKALFEVRQSWGSRSFDKGRGVEKRPDPQTGADVREK